MSGAIDGATAADLTARLTRHDRDGDDAVLLDHAAQDRALGLHAAVLRTREGRTDVATLRILGRWFLRRYYALPPGAGQADLRSARLYAGLLRDLGNTAVPDDLRVLLDGNPDMTARTNETALALLDEFEATGDERRVIAAGQLIGLLDSVLPTDHPFRRDLLSSMSQLASARVLLRADVTEADAMVRAARAALAAADRAEPSTMDKLRQLVAALVTRYELSTETSYLDEAQELAERTLREQPGEQPYLASTLAQVLRLRFESTHRTTDLDRAVALSRDAVRAVPSGHPLHLVLLQNQMICLLRRVEHLDAEADLTEAIEVCREMGPKIGTGGPVRCSWLEALALLLAWRTQRTGTNADLVEASNLSREAVGLSGHLGAIRDWVLANHAAIMFLRFSVEGDRAQLTEAIETCRQAVDASPGGQVRGNHLATLARMLTADRTDLTALDEAVAVGRRAVSMASAGHPQHVIAAYSLATAHARRFRATGDKADRVAAVDLARAAALSPVGKPDLRMRSAQLWLTETIGLRDFDAAARAGEAGVALLPVLAWRGLDRNEQEQRLADVSGMATLAAAIAIETGNPRRAVELVEQGRSVLWGQALQIRGDLSALRAAAPALAGELDRTRHSLNRLATEGTVGLGQDDRFAREYRAQVERWDTLLAKARAMPGFASFLGTTPFDELHRAAGGGTVVVVNVCEPRCDALLVRAGDVRAVRLPWLSLGDAYRRAEALLAAVAETEAGGTAAAWAHLRQTLISLLRWLWDVVAAPVLSELDTAGTGPHRVWWCPTGPLTLLPLHAAGRYGTPSRWDLRRRPTVPDRTVSSYTTGLGALLNARNRPVTGDAATLLAVGMPRTPGRAPLPAVVDELRRITGTVPSSRTLIGASATPDTVLAELGGHAWAHFACHATQRVDRPGAGALHLSGGDLTVLRCAGQELAGAEFAYLSACHTAGGSMALADEAINLAAALQLAGYRHVIGTLWPVSDTHAATVADTVYRTLTSSGRPAATNAATALSRATAALRERYPERPELWAPFVHLGP
jgi:CHAT domain-containing protein